MINFTNGSIWNRKIGERAQALWCYAGNVLPDSAFQWLLFSVPIMCKGFVTGCHAVGLSEPTIAWFNRCLRLAKLSGKSESKGAGILASCINSVSCCENFVIQLDVLGVDFYTIAMWI